MRRFTTKLVPVAIATVLATLLAAGAPAQACRVQLPPGTLIGNGYASGGYGAVLLVRVEAAAAGRAMPDRQPWRARARVVRVLDGASGAGAVRFGRSGAATACDDGAPLPRRGDEWVIYLERGTGAPRVAGSYPRAVAAEADPRVAARLRDPG